MSGMRLMTLPAAMERAHAQARQACRVVFHRCATDAAAYPSEHDIATKASVARHLAALLEARFEESLPLNFRRSQDALYLVPSHTLDPRSLRRALQPLACENFFGGFVPYPFVASKLITHPLTRREAGAPKGWSHEYGEAVRDVVLPGRSVFTRADARLAAEELLALGPVRVKEGGGVGGVGQTVVYELRELEAQLAALDSRELLRTGLVLEQNLTEVSTGSIGQVQVGPWLASYYGVQYPTRNGRGHAVYGGSTLNVVRGGLEELPARAPSDAVRTAAQQALIYHREAFRCFPGLIASRCNYDVLQGVDGGGNWKSGVLEQSWRIGGASGAEIAALHCFRDDPARSRVRVSTVEAYGAEARAPAGAIIHYDGPDQHGDRLLKYVQIEPDDDD